MTRRPVRWRWLALGAAAAVTALASAWVRGLFRVLNPDQARRLGTQLVRGPRRVLAVTAHPDDLEFLAGGTLRLLGLAGSRITVVVASTGGGQRHAPGDEAPVRAQEQRDAGVVLGYDDVRLLNFRDLDLAYNPALEPAIDRIWDEVRPDLVLTMDPAHPYPFYVHPDHLAVGRAVLNLARQRGEPGHRVLFYGSRRANVLVDVTQVLEDKIQGVLAHKSQLKLWPWAYGLLVRGLARLAGRQAGMGYAEAFRALEPAPLGRQAYAGQWPPPAPAPRKPSPRP